MGKSYSVISIHYLLIIRRTLLYEYNIAMLSLIYTGL